MYRNKYTFWKRGLLRLQEVVPVLSGTKRLASLFKTRSFAKRLARRRAEIERVRRETGRAPLFRHVEMETFNRCNGGCGFCPVNRHLDTRKPTKMPEELFASIIRQLVELDYGGELCLYSNNESLLEDRIEDFTARAREALPRAKIFLSTNGTLLTPDRYRALVDNVDLFYVNNYCRDFALTPGNEEIVALARTREDWWRKTHVVVRYERELMSSRGGQAPNRRGGAAVACGCPHPAEQFIIRPDGKVSLCCNDALGRMTLGDLSTESVAEVWWGEAFEAVRGKILESRDGVELCRRCDTLPD